MIQGKVFSGTGGALLLVRNFSELKLFLLLMQLSDGFAALYRCLLPLLLLLLRLWLEAAAAQ